MQVNIVDSRHVTMVVSNNLVLLKVPTLDRLVFTTRKEIGLARTNNDSTNCTDMACESEFKVAASEIPNLQNGYSL